MKMMNEKLRKDARMIIEETLESILPDKAVKEALNDFSAPQGKTVLIAAGKAAWQMAKAASEAVKIDSGVVITKYGHSRGEIKNCRIFEAGHPVLDQNTLRATAEALEEVKDLSDKDSVLFLLSGGASALFELPLVPLEELQELNSQLLKCGADITEINTLRKRLSSVKGGRFAKACEPAKVFSIVLSDVLGDPLDVIGSGPAYPDSSTCEEALAVARRYSLRISPEIGELLKQETPKELVNVTTVLAGNIHILCEKASEICRRLGYETVLLSETLCCEARDAGRDLAQTAIRTAAETKKKTALIEGGETVVKVRGNGLGGRNQELVLSAVRSLAGKNVALFSIGSDGTDGPTDAAGAYADGDTFAEMKKKGIDPSLYLDNNDSYHAFEAVGTLIITGPTGTNINDLTVALIGE